jgi:outer membrane protein
MLSKISLGISAVLAILVGYLFLQKGGNTEIAPLNLPVTTNADGQSTIKPVIVAYFNGDSIMAKYAFFQDKKVMLEGNVKTSENQLRQEAASKQKEIEELVNYARTSELTEENKAEVEQRIYELQMEMQQSEDKASNTLLDKQNAANLEMMDRIEAYAKEYAQQNGIDYVLSYQRSAQVIFYSNPAYDITAQLLAGLNARYLEEKNSK